MRDRVFQSVALSSTDLNHITCLSDCRTCIRVIEMKRYCAFSPTLSLVDSVRSCSSARQRKYWRTACLRNNRRQTYVLCLMPRHPYQLQFGPPNLLVSFSQSIVCLRFYRLRLIDYLSYIIFGRSWADNLLWSSKPTAKFWAWRLADSRSSLQRRIPSARRSCLLREHQRAPC